MELTKKQKYAIKAAWKDIDRHDAAIKLCTSVRTIDNIAGGFTKVSGWRAILIERFFSIPFDTMRPDLVKH